MNMNISAKNLLHLLAALSITAGSSACGSGNDSGDEPEDPETPSVSTTLVKVTVLDYSPAPGQFINEIPEYEPGDDQESMNNKVSECLNNGDMISLGAWGGNVTLRLQEPIKNLSGITDFKILGNGVYASSSTEEKRYGSAEPGIVLVMKDENRNGIADDQWYELKGDQTFNGIEEYSVTYHAPTSEATDAYYIKWESTDGDNGYINRVSSYHTQDFFPRWKNASTLTFTGRRLPDNGYFNSETKKYDLVCYAGYADSHPNTSYEAWLDLDNAIDENGSKATLDAIDFIKIYTGVLQSNGMLGECSTEIAGIEIATE